MTQTSIQKLASEARALYTLKTRNDGSKFWSVDHETAPEWVDDMNREAHGDMVPDDWRYSFIVEALDALEDAEDPDDVNLEADIYNHELTRWLGSHGNRPGYCDEAMQEFGVKFQDTISLIQLGQWREKNEVLGSVRYSLEARAASMEEEQAEDEDSEDEGPDEEDIVTEDHRTFSVWSQAGKKVAFTVPDGEEWEPHARAYMEREGFYPNFWFLSDHGNWILLSIGEAGDEA